MGMIKRKNGRFLNVERKIYNGTEIIEIREYIVESEKVIPTKKGINVSIEYLDAILRELFRISERKMKERTYSNSEQVKGDTYAEK